jgi:hypothetical protein
MTDVSQATGGIASLGGEANASCAPVSNPVQLFIVVPTGSSIRPWAVAHSDDPEYFLARYRDVVHALKNARMLNEQVPA